MMQMNLEIQVVGQKLPTTATCEVDVRNPDSVRWALMMVRDTIVYSADNFGIGSAKLTLTPIGGSNGPRKVEQKC